MLLYLPSLSIDNQLSLYSPRFEMMITRTWCHSYVHPIAIPMDQRIGTSSENQSGRSLMSLSGRVGGVEV